MRSVLPSKFTCLPISLFMGGCLVLISQYNPAQAQVNQLDEIPINERALPQLQPIQPVEFYNQNYQLSQPTQISQNNQNFERYFVYVDSNNTQTLQRIRQIESSAYIRNYDGRNVIQAGVFNRLSGAQQRVRELASYGINSARIVGFSNTDPVYSYNPTDNDPGISYYNPTYDNEPIDRRIPRRQSSTAYYVVIPTTSGNLRSLGEQVRQSIGQNRTVWLRTQPRGAHIAVGPFSDRPEAEQWNNYLRKLGYGEARVYYGK